jgi:P-type Cu+ transporter
MGSGTDVARESADIVLLGDNLLKLVEAVRIAAVAAASFGKPCGTLLVDAFGILLAALRFLNTLLAAFVHVSSEPFFILNSSRLLPRPKK